MAAPGATPDAELAALVKECWPRAQAHWSRFLLLQPPADASKDRASLDRGRGPSGELGFIR